MGKTTTFLASSVGRKMTVALSGLFLCSFLIVHLGINLFALKAKSDGGAEFNTYAHFMATHPVIKPLEWILFAGFLLHAILGLFLAVKNRQARPERYEVNKAGENSTWTSRFAWFTGLFVGVFLVVHIKTFFWESRFIRDQPMINFIVEAFSSPAYVAFYMVALVFLAYHLKHGFQSALQTFGVRAGRYRSMIEWLGVFFWLIIPIGFAIIPLYFLFAY